MLTPIVDHLFDKGFISFEGQGRGGGHQARTYMTPDAAMNASLEGLALPVMSRSAFRASAATHGW